MKKCGLFEIMALEMRVRNCYVNKNSGTRGAEICALEFIKIGPWTNPLLILTFEIHNIVGDWEN